MGRVGESELPAWVSAAIPAAVRLAAEAGTEVDDVLRHAATDDAGRERLARQAGRLEQSAELTDVATDLAGLLWAECEDVPRIATILEEPAAQAALEAVAEARRLAAARLAADAASSTTTPAVFPSPLVMTAAAASPAVAGPPALEAVAEAGLQPDRRLTDGAGEARQRDVDWLPERPPIEQNRAEADHEIQPPAAVPAPVGRHAPAAPPLPEHPSPPAQAASWSSGSNHQPATGALLAGAAAAAAILLFGRRLRRA